MSLMDKLKKVGSLESRTVAESEFFNDRDSVPTDVPAFNVALGGSTDGGVNPGLLMVCGESKTFKTTMSLKLVSAYMKKYKDAVCLYYDSEFGSTKTTFASSGIDSSRVLHIPILHIEQLKFDLVKKLENIEKGNKVIIFIDSIGNLASKKEAEDASDEKSTTDMTRARSLASLWRIVTPHFTLKDIPCIAINHVYMEQGAMYPRAIVSGGQKGILSSNTIWIITKSQEKEGTDLVGFNFKITVEKSRFVIEKSQIPITVRFDSGIDKYSGMMDLALEGGFVQKPSNGWYALVDRDTGELGQKKRFVDTQNDDFLGKVVYSKEFNEFIKKKYKLAHAQMMNDDEVAAEFPADDSED